MFRIVVLALLLVQPCWAEPPKLKIESEIKPSGQYVVFVPETTAKSVLYLGLSGVDPVPSSLLRDGRTFLLDTRGLPAGRYQFAAVGCLDNEQARADFAVVVGVPPPGPGPLPPGPGPVPPGPIPPTPIPGEGLRVLIVEETAKRSELPAAQQAVIFSQVVRDYLNKKCGPDPDVSSWKSWRILDPDQVLVGHESWKALRDKAIGKPLPYVLIQNRAGTLVHEGSLPANVPAMLELLKRFGGE